MISLKDAFEDFLNAKRVENRSPATIKYYQAYVGGFVVATGDDMTLTDVQPLHVRNHLARIQERGRSANTLQTFYRAAKAFFRWSMAEYDIDAGLYPLKNVKLPKAEKAEPKAADLEDVLRLLRACDNSLTGIRDRALILMLLDTGCRAGGVTRLRRRDLNLDGCSALVNEKDKRARRVHFTDGTAQALRAWLEVSPAKGDHVFCSLKMQTRGQPLSTNGLSHVFMRLGRKAGVKGRVNPHSLRHAFAREVLQNGGDLARLSQLMGHSNVSTTVSFYAVFNDRELHEHHQRHSPIRGLGLHGSTTGFLEG